ncbi:MAG: hypothetical protein ACJAWT_001383 [Glaciecola sp.]|jgi:hypothetical protein
MVFTWAYLRLKHKNQRKGMIQKRLKISVCTFLDRVDVSPFYNRRTFIYNLCLLFVIFVTEKPRG